MEIATLICNDDLDYESFFNIYSIFASLRKNGNDVRIVDYNLQKEENSKFNLNSKNKLLYNFIDENLVLTSKKYSDIKQLEDNKPLADRYIIYNATENEADIFPKNETILYGIRKDKINEVNTQDYMSVSVIDKEDSEIQNVVEPIFLLSKEEWENFASNSNRVENDEKYNLVYGDIVTKEMLKYAKNLSSKDNSKIYIVADKIEPLIHKGKKLNNVLPTELVSLIGNAQNIITSKTDAIELALILEKKLHIFKDGVKIEKVNEYQLLDRMVESSDRIILKNIDYNFTLSEIKKYREKSLEIFR